jgi:hypothetical protein
LASWLLEEFCDEGRDRRRVELMALSGDDAQLRVGQDGAERNDRVVLVGGALSAGEGEHRNVDGREAVQCRGVAALGVAP